jgi:hypothetical protein
MPSRVRAHLWRPFLAVGGLTVFLAIATRTGWLWDSAYALFALGFVSDSTKAATLCERAKAVQPKGMRAAIQVSLWRGLAAAGS